MTSENLNTPTPPTPPCAFSIVRCKCHSTDLFSFWQTCFYTCCNMTTGDKQEHDVTKTKKHETTVT